MAKVGIWVLGDQLHPHQSALAGCRAERNRTPVLLVESRSHSLRRRYHRQKLILVWSAMRHFALELEQEGWPVTYARCEDFTTAVAEWIEREGITELRLMRPADRGLETLLLHLGDRCRVTVLPNTHFLWQPEEFAAWARGYRQLRLENFYREGRRRWGVLMEGDQPAGDRWNFDKENRKPPKAGLQTPAPPRFEPDAITRAAIADVQALDTELYGAAEPFAWAVTRREALQALDDFIATRLPGFGPYQDAMVTGEPTLWHGLIAPYLNLGLLEPQEVIAAVETAWRRGDCELACAEGFIRQVLGWREYMHGLYHLFGPDYATSNHFDHQRPLPAFFWSGDTDLNCLRQCFGQLQQSGYAHHIQRLMVLGNFALIAGLEPQAVVQWFHATFIDAHDWVMQTNVLGMALYADGGRLASKPYAASASYINRMSTYCRDCRYDPKQRTGDRACPFNSLYWDFLLRHRPGLEGQGRMGLIYRQLDRFSEAEQQALQDRAQTWLRDHCPG
jgi:deoxyribodipyrimidine photolyase-related protein